MASNDGNEAPKKKKRQITLHRDIVIKRLNRRGSAQKESPLAQLQEIFEEVEDKGRFVGDTMFWKYFPDIAIERIYHTDSVEYRNLRVMFWETVFYLILLTFFTTYVYSLQSRDVFSARQEQEQYWSGCNSTGLCKIHGVNSLGSFWDYMHDEFVDRAWTEYADPPPNVATVLTPFNNNEFAIKWHPRFFGEKKSNLLLGTVRLRQLRVQKNEGCAVSKMYAHIYPDCYGMYGDGVKSQRSFVTRFVPTYIKKAYEYQTEEETMQASYAGKFAIYGGDGFAVELPWNATDSRTMISDLRQWAWVDRATRAVVVELSSLNTNVNVITNTRILFEFGPTGSVTGYVQSLGGRVSLFTPSTTTSEATTIFAMQIILFILFVLFAMYSVWLMVKTCKNFIGENPLQYIRRQSFIGQFTFFFRIWWHYLRYLWNLCDLVMIALFFIHMSFRFSTYSAISASENMGAKHIGHPELFMPFSGVIAPLTLSNNILSILALLVWVKLFKYSCMSTYFRFLVRILEMCFVKLFVFSILLVCIMFGFAVSFFVGWGGTEERYSWISGAFLVNFFLLMDGFTVNEEWFNPGASFVMPLVFFVYIAFIYFVLMNIAVATVLDIYATADRSVKEDPNRKNPMLVFLYTYYKMMLGISLVRDTAEENMKKEDLSIQVELLPGVVRRKWMEKKKKMQAIADASFAGMEIFPLEYQMDGKANESSSDWMLPSSRQDVFETMDVSSNRRPLSLYDIPQAMLKSEISRAQLQRLMDEDPSLPILLHESRAEMVIRRFKNLEVQSPVENDEGLNAVKKLQGQVFGQIDALEKVKLDEDIPQVPRITEMTQDMSEAITSVRNNFRIQLTGIIEATAVLFEHLVEVTQGLDAVRENHTVVLDAVRESQEKDLLQNPGRALFKK